MITIDGSEGEGGGQVLRNSVALSLITGQPCRITNIRGKRDKPGLMRQHLTSIEAACAISGSACDGLAMQSSEITFRPGSVRGGDYHFAVGTAGSTGLVLQTILIPLLYAEAPSRLVLEGGTHAMAAPPFDFIERTFLPILGRMGPQVTAKLIRHGFYPRGGGRIEVDIAPAPLHPIECTDRGAFLGLKGEARVAGIPFDVADREVKKAQKILNCAPDALAVRQLPDEHGPGNVLLLEAEYEHVTEIVSGFGKLGVPAEALAKTAAQRIRGYMESDAFAGPYLCDQLLLPMAIAGRGAFTSVKPSLHARTAADVIERFTGKKTNFEERAGSSWLISIG